MATVSYTRDVWRLESVIKVGVVSTQISTERNFTQIGSITGLTLRQGWLPL